jgi:hypothetical protein
MSGRRTGNGRAEPRPWQEWLDASSYPPDTVAVWFDAGFHRPRTGPSVVIAAFVAESLRGPVPFIAPFPGGGATYATEMKLAFGSYGFDPARVIPKGVPSAEKLAKLEAEFFDLCAGWAGLNYVRLNRHVGHVVMVCDGKSAVEFMRHEHDLDLSDRGIETGEMRTLIERLAAGTQGVEWLHAPKGENPAIERNQARLKDFLRNGITGKVEFRTGTVGRVK